MLMLMAQVALGRKVNLLARQVVARNITCWVVQSLV